MDIVSPDFKANPFPLFARLRVEEPVCSTILSDKTRVWLLSRYEDVNYLFKEDLTSALIQTEEAGDALSEDELLAMVFLLLVAGHETTVNLIASGVLELLEHRDQMDKLRSDPSMIRTAVEELLRYTSPVFMATERYAREDVTIRGVTIPQGEMALGVIGSANRDEAVFENPGVLDLTRENNKHLAFGVWYSFLFGCSASEIRGSNRDQYTP